MQTPWGPAQHRTPLGDGMIEVSTATHGGIYVPPNLNREIRGIWRREDCWYEQDCDWAIVALTYPDRFPQPRLDVADELARRWYPEQYNIVMGGAEGGEPQTPAIDLDALWAAVDPGVAEELPADKLEAMMARARTLLGVAEQSAHAEERETAARAAAEVMARYGITAAMLAADGKVSDKVGTWDVTTFAPYTLDKAILLTSVVDAYGGKTIRLAKGGQNTDLRVFAMSSDLARVQVLFPSLLAQMETELRWALVGKPSHVRSDVFSRNFIAGFTAAVVARLKAAEQRARQQAQAERDAQSPGGTSVALVLVGRKSEVERAFKEAFPSTATSRRTRRTGAGVGAGVRAGERADIGQAKVGA